jgi:hypothetical protein
MNTFNIVKMFFDLLCFIAAIVSIPLVHGIWIVVVYVVAGAFIRLLIIDANELGSK